MIGHPEKKTIMRDPEFEGERDDAMEFRLTYEGVLLGTSRNSKRTAHKHEIRQIFHKQLRRLFELHPAYANCQPTTQDEVEIADHDRALELTAAHKVYVGSGGTV